MRGDVLEMPKELKMLESESRRLARAYVKAQGEGKHAAYDAMAVACHEYEAAFDAWLGAWDADAKARRSDDCGGLA